MVTQSRLLVGATVLATALVAYNNLRPSVGGVTYVGLNLLVGVVVGMIAVVMFGANGMELGLSENRPTIVARVGLAAVLLVAPLFVLAAFQSSARLVADDRVAGLSASEVVWHALVRIPLGTALFEEFVFRGALFGILSRRGPLFAAVASSIPFGLWHIRPALGVIDANAPGSDAIVVALWLVAVVFTTWIAGMIFCWLRIKGAGIAAPFVGHAAVNSLSLVAAAFAHRQLP